MASNEVTEGERSVAGGIVDSDVPTGATIFGWINEICEQGIRRPGYPADQWTEQRCAEHFRDLGMENVRLEPVEVSRWEPQRWSLEVMAGGRPPVQLDCFPVPYGTQAEDLQLELAVYDLADPSRVAGKASLYDVTLLELPALTFVASGDAPREPDELARRVIDPEQVLSTHMHRLPFPPEMNNILEPSVDAGAAAFIGSLKNYPGGLYEYYIPYDGKARGIPGVWISGRDGDWLAGQVAEGAVRVRLTIESSREQVRCHNVVGELPGADEDVVLIGSHHDGPWASAVEDASGTALVLAQASYWAAQPRERRPHRMVFLLHAAHMAAIPAGETNAGLGEGHAQFLRDHRPELDGVVLQVHLEHAALECEESADGSVVPIDRPVPRWFFTSRIPRLEDAVIEALEVEKLHRSIVLAPNAIGEQPVTDGAFFYHEGVPLMQFLAAPFYLFDAADTPDKIDRHHLVPLTRAVIRIIESTAGVSAEAMRAADLYPPRASERSLP